MVQTITISGRLGADAEVRQVNSDTVTSFNMAVDQGYADRKTSNWFRVSIWGKKGAGAQPYLLKGGVVTVVGELEIGEYNGKMQLNVRAYDFTLPPKSGGERQQASERPPAHRNQSGFGGGNAPSFDDDLQDSVPF